MHYTQPEVYEFISKQTNDPIVEWKTCRISGTKFPIYQSDTEFYDKISPTFDGKKYKIPTPTLCPEERQRRRLMRRNERKLYRRQCGASNKSIISNYRGGTEYTVYNIHEWYSDHWSAKDAGIRLESSDSVNQHIKKVMEQVPHISLMVKMNENCDYVNGCGNSKNCYLVFDTDFCENCYYSNILKSSQNIVDSSHIYFCDTVYNSINCTESYSLMNCDECDQSKYLWNCTRCSNCEYCCNCTNLVGKKYYINNQPVTKDEFLDHIKERVWTWSYPTGLERSVYIVNSESSYGNNIYGSKGCICSHNIGFSENLKYCDLVTDAQNCYDISSFGGTTQRCLDSSSVGLDCTKIYFSNIVTAGSSNIWYSYALIGCKDMFACACMKNAQYCIFNKQYTREEYERIVPIIIEKMQREGVRGEFLDVSLSPFSYNETLAMDYYPLGKSEALEKGYTWYDDTESRNISFTSTALVSNSLPKQINEVSDDIVNKVIVCEVSGRPYRIIKQELDFYRKHNIPLPRKHPDIRHEERMAQRPGRNLYLRKCDQCEEEMMSVYPVNHTAKVYCDGCYKKIVYG